MTELKDAMPVAFNTPEIRFDCPEERKFAAIAEVKAQPRRGGRAGRRHRRRARQDGGRLVAGAGLEHAGRAGGARRGWLARGAGAAEGRGAAAAGPGRHRGAGGVLSSQSPLPGSAASLVVITTACRSDAGRRAPPFCGGSEQRLRVLQHHVADLVGDFRLQAAAAKAEGLTAAGVQEAPYSRLEAAVLGALARPR